MITSNCQPNLNKGFILVIRFFFASLKPLKQGNNADKMISTKMLTTKMLIKEKKMFIGRKEELESIKTRLDSNGYKLGIIYGQRRIGN